MTSPVAMEADASALLPPTVAALLADLIEGIGEGMAAAIPGFPGQMAGGYLRRRGARARLILAEELTARNLDLLAAVDGDLLMAAVFRFQRALAEGASDMVLRWLARLLDTLVHSGVLSSAASFAALAGAMGELSAEEAFLLVRMQAHRRAWEAEAVAGRQAPALPWTRTIAELVPSLYDGLLDLEKACARLARTGLVAPVPAAGPVIAWRTTPLMDEIEGVIRMTDLKEAGSS